MQIQTTRDATNNKTKQKHFLSFEGSCSYERDTIQNIKNYFLSY